MSSSKSHKFQQQKMLSSKFQNFQKKLQNI